MKDYLTTYVTEDGFDVCSLFNDDYFLAIKLCFNNRRYISAAKLLFSFIDTLGYLEFGDTPRSFQRWLETYADLMKVGATPDELWEYRNSLLHMTNPDSRRVASGKVNRLHLYVGYLPTDFPAPPGSKNFGLWQLLNAIFDSMPKYCDSFSVDRAKFESFVEKYDRVISDVRYMEFDWPEHLRSNLES